MAATHKVYAVSSIILEKVKSKRAPVPLVLVQCKIVFDTVPRISHMPSTQPWQCSVEKLKHEHCSALCV